MPDEPEDDDEEIYAEDDPRAYRMYQPGEEPEPNFTGNVGKKEAPSDPIADAVKRIDSTLNGEKK